MVNITTTGGQTFSARVDQPLRGPQNLALPDRLESKFKDCAALALRPDTVPRLYERLRNLELLSNVRELTDFMAGAVIGAGANRAVASVNKAARTK